MALNQLEQSQVKGLQEFIEERSGWQKPSDWIDIRSGALENSIYFLVAHTTPTGEAGSYVISDWDILPIQATLSNTAHTYDIYIDGILYKTLNSGTVENITWSTLYNNGTVSSGFNVTYPIECVTHVVRITPSDSSDTIVRLQSPETADTVYQGILWAHFNITNGIRLTDFFGSESNSNAHRNAYLEAITAKDNEITMGGSCSGLVRSATRLKALPTINLGGQTILFYRSFQGCAGFKKIKFKNGYANCQQCFSSCNVETIETENAAIMTNTRSFEGTHYLKKLPSLDWSPTNGYNAFVDLVGLQNTIIDASQCTTKVAIHAFGTSSSNFCSGIKGVIVSPHWVPTSQEAIKVNYTNMDRNSLIKLFKSMPYNNGYEVTGNPTITDGIASGFSASDTITSKLAFPNAQAVNGCAWQVKFTTPATAPGSNGSRLLGMYFGNVADAVGFSQTMYPFWRLKGSTAAITTETEMQLSTTYFMSGYIANGVAHLLLGTSEDNQIEIGSLELPELTIGTARRLFIGTTTIPNMPYTGSIDLNYTWAKIGGVYWYRGADAAMTKTCSIVGCTGTADLTADDKAIAEDKGWELVLS